MKANTIFLIFIILLSPKLFPQTAKVSNEKPQWGDKVEITYAPDSSSKFTMHDEVNISYFIYREDYSTEHVIEKMQRVEGSFVAELTIAKGTALYAFNFQAEKEWDRRARLSLKPVSAEGTYYRNAYSREAGNSQEAFDKELASYPENLTIYRSRWQFLPYIKGDSADYLIEQELTELEKTEANAESYHYAVCSGYILLGKFDQARASFDELITNHPKSPLLADLHSLYSYTLFSKSTTDSLLSRRVYDFICENPTSELAKNNIYTLYKKSQIKDKKALYKISKYWMEAEPDNAIMYYHHARALDDPKEKLFYLNKATNTLLDGELRTKNGYYWDGNISYELPNIIEGYEEIGAYAQGLALISLLEQNSKKIEAYVYEQKAKLFQGLNRKKEALNSYIIALDMGSKTVKDSVESLYNLLSIQEDLESYKEKVLTAHFNADAATAAPEFSAVDLEGNTFDLASLRGKVVVLNFWFIGCAPCRVEIPGLNEMVEHYGEDVVFLAFALDAKEELDEFLTETPFNYAIIPESFEQSTAYGVSGYPTHVVIDKEGKIRSTLTGGSKDRHEQIMPIIDRFLKL